MAGQRPRAVTPLLLVLPGLWSSLSLNRVHYSGPRVTENGSFSQQPGVTHPRNCLRQPSAPPLRPTPLHHHPHPHPGQTAILLLTPHPPSYPHSCDGDPGATSAVFTPTLVAGRWRGMMDGLTGPRSIVAPPNTVNTRRAFVFQSRHNARGGSIAGESELFYVYTHADGVSTSRQLQKIRAGSYPERAIGQDCFFVCHKKVQKTLLLWITISTVILVWFPLWPGDFDHDTWCSTAGPICLLVTADIVESLVTFVVSVFWWILNTCSKSPLTTFFSSYNVQFSGCQ